MGADTKFFDQLIKNIKLSIHTMAPARVLSFNESNKTADIELLFLSSNSNGELTRYAPIDNVPIIGMRYKVNGAVEEYIPYLKKDDVVYVGFAERAMDNLDGPKVFDPDFRRTHSTRDAVILGVIF